MDSMSKANDNLGTGVNAFGASSKRQKLEIRSAMKKHLSNKTLGNGQDAQKMIGLENHNAVHEDSSVASHHFQPKPSELNQKLGTGVSASGTSPQLQKQPLDKRVRKSVNNLKTRNPILKERLLRLSEKCQNIDNENKSIMEELAAKYGQEQVENLMNE